MRVLEGNKQNAIPLVQFLCAVPCGTRVYVTTEYRDDVHMHKVTNAKEMLKFLAKMNKIYGHHLKVYEIHIVHTDFVEALESTCI